MAGVSAGIPRLHLHRTLLPKVWGLLVFLLLDSWELLLVSVTAKQ